MGSHLGTILNVNDHEQTRYLVTRMLHAAGFRVLEAATGEDALRLARELPDLVVLDVKLPDISGFEVCRMLKASPETGSVLVLQTSATYVTAEKKVEGLEAGADGYLTHPFEPMELIATVKSLLRLRHAEQELRRRADQLIAADKRKDEFLAMLAHELRNPLAAIVAVLPKLERRDFEQIERARQVIDRQSRHLARLVDDLLDVSRITRGKVDLRREVIDLSGPLNEAVRVGRALCEGRRQTLEVSLPDRDLMINADAARLQQVFSNLLDNASKYSHPGARIEVRLEHKANGGSDWAEVTVRDDGMGIAPALLPHVFELFVQADESLDRSRGGMGIGLTLVKRLVELHGGRVEACSDGLGKGSCFIVRLPLLGTRRLTPPAPVPAVRPPSSPVRVLVVEDNVDIREALEEALRDDGHAVEAVADGIKGLERALSGQHELAIVDIGLPGMSGYELAAQLRSRAPNIALRLIALTGYGGPEARRRAIEAGFDDHLPKPIRIENLLSIVARAEERHGGKQS